MRGNSGVAHSQEPFRNDSGYFKAVEALRPCLPENSSHCVPDPGGSEGSKERHFAFRRHTKEISARMYLAIERGTVDSAQDGPPIIVRLNFEREELCDPGSVSDQNCSDLYCRRHSHPQRHCRVVTVE